MELTKNWQKIGEETIGSGGYGNITLRLYARYVSQSTEDNSSLIQVELRHYLPSSYSHITYYSSSQRFIGEIIKSSSNTTNKTMNPGETVLLSETKNIQHNEDGNKNIFVGGSFTNSYFGNTVTINQVNLDLPKINRLNTIVLNDGNFFFIDKGENESNEIPVKITKYIEDYTSNLKLYYQTTSEEDATRYELGERTNFNDIVLTFTNEELTTMYNAMPNTRSLRFICVIETYNSETKLGETEYITVANLSGTDLYPTFNNFEYEDTNEITLALTGDSQILIKGYSNVEMTVSQINKAIAHKGATIKQYTFVNGTPIQDITTISYPIIAEPFKPQNKELSVIAIDSRDLTINVVKNLSNKWIEYKDIEKISFTAERKNAGTSTQVTLKLSGNIWDGNFGAVENSIKSAIYKYKKTTDGEDAWVDGTTDLIIVKDGDSYSLEQDIVGDLGATGFDQEESYDIYVEVSDQLSTISDAFTLGAGSPGIARYKNCVALGAPYDEQMGGRVQIPKVAGETDFVTNLKKRGKEVATLENTQRSVITVGYNSNSNQTLNTTLTKAQLNTVLSQTGNTSKLSLDTTNYAVKIGTGVSKVLVSAFAVVNSNVGVTETASFNITTMKNDFKLTNDYVTRPSGIGGYYIGESLSPVLVDVEEGDLITLQLLGTQPTSNLIVNTDTANNNYLTVEVIE